MEKQVGKRFTWVIKNFEFLQSEYICSDEFVADGCKWRLLAYPKGKNKDDNLSLYLNVADYELLPGGWRRYAKVSFTIVNQKLPEISFRREVQHWFDLNCLVWGFPTMFSFTTLKAKNSGFLVNGDLKIVAEVTVLKVIAGKTDVREETLSFMDVHGFQVLPSQVKSVNRLIERHPEIATKNPYKNQYLKTGYMNVLLILTETLRRSPKEISKDELADAYVLLESMNEYGFKLDWLEKKLDQVSEKKKKEAAGEARMQEIEEELKDLKRKCSDLEAQLEKEKAEVLAAITPLSLSDDDDDF